MLKKFLATLLASLSLFTVTAAQATSAQALSLSNAPVTRAATSAGDSNELAEAGTGVYVLGAIALGLAVWGIVELVGDDTPDSA